MSVSRHTTLRWRRRLAVLVPVTLVAGATSVVLYATAGDGGGTAVQRSELSSLVTTGDDRPAAESGRLGSEFGKASDSVAMTGGGTKFTVRGPITGPSGATWNITSAWGVDSNGTVRLITATP